MTTATAPAAPTPISARHLRLTRKERAMIAEYQAEIAEPCRRIREAEAVIETAREPFLARMRASEAARVPALARRRERRKAAAA